MQSLRSKDVLRADQFTKDEIALIMATASRFETTLRASETSDILKHRVLCTLFYEPSTRTRLSFETAMLRLGGKVISVAEARSSSASKGESLHDTIKTVEGYADLIVLRHPQIGAAEEAARATEKPLLNAGDGAGQHPTQALLDLYTIRNEHGSIDGQTVLLAGDLKHGRTVHSLALLLSLYDVRFIFASPPALRMPREIVDQLDSLSIPVEETDSLTEALHSADVLYMTRIQQERFSSPQEYDRLKGSYVLTSSLVQEAKPSLIIMHPLPRVDEIATEVDLLSGAAYFRQSANGVPVRMALLALLSGHV